MLWLHVGSDALIAIAYCTIPVTLIYFVRRRKDLQFNWMFLCFAIFILACGASHVMEIWKQRTAAPGNRGAHPDGGNAHSKEP